MNDPIISHEEYHAEIKTLEQKNYDLSGKVAEQFTRHNDELEWYSERLRAAREESMENWNRARRAEKNCKTWQRCFWILLVSSALIISTL